MVIVGVDTNGEVHVAVGVDQLSRRLGETSQGSEFPDMPGRFSGGAGVVGPEDGDHPPGATVRVMPLAARAVRWALRAFCRVR